MNIRAELEFHAKRPGEKGRFEPSGWRFASERETTDGCTLHCKSKDAHMAGCAGMHNAGENYSLHARALRRGRQQSKVLKCHVTEFVLAVFFFGAFDKVRDMRSFDV